MVPDLPGTTVQIGTQDDLAELARLYHATYAHATDVNLTRGIKPKAVNE